MLRQGQVDDGAIWRPLLHEQGTVPRVSKKTSPPLILGRRRLHWQTQTRWHHFPLKKDVPERASPPDVCIIAVFSASRKLGRNDFASYLGSCGRKRRDQWRVARHPALHPQALALQSRGGDGAAVLMPVDAHTICHALCSRRTPAPSVVVMVVAEE